MHAEHLNASLECACWNLNCAKLVGECGISNIGISIGNKEWHGGCGKKLARWGLAGVRDYGACLEDLISICFVSFL